MTPTPRQTRAFQVDFPVATMAASPDGKFVAVGNDGPDIIIFPDGHSEIKGNWQPRVEILDAVTGRTIVAPVLMSQEDEAMLAGFGHVPQFVVTALAFSPDASLLAVGNSAGQVKLFDARTGALVRSLDDAEEKQSDTNTPGKYRPFTRAIGSVTALAFSPAGGTLAVCGGSFADVHVFEKSSGVLDTSLAPSGSGRLKIWDVKTGALKHSFSGHADDVRAVAFSGDGKWLASAGNWLDVDDKGRIEGIGWGVKILDAGSGALEQKLEDPSNAGPRSVAFSPDGRKIAIGSQRFADKKGFRDESSGAVTLVQISSRVTEWMHVVPGLAWNVKYAPDGNSVMVLGDRHSVDFLDAKDGAVTDTLCGDASPKHGKWTSLSCAPGAGLVFLGGTDAEKNGTVEIWNEMGAKGANELQKKSK